MADIKLFRVGASELIDAIDQATKVLTGELQLPKHKLEEQT